MEEKIVELVSALGADAVGVAYAFVAVKAFEIAAIGVLSYVIFRPLILLFKRMIEEG